MASGSFSQSFTSYNYKVIVDWSSVATTSSNSSVITADISLYCVYSLRTSQHDGSKITINGVEYPFTSPTINTDGGTIHLATITSNAIAHDSDGNKSVKIVCDYAVNATISGTYYGTITASDTVDLDLIPRQATLTSAENFNDEGNPTITYSNPAGSAVSGLQAAIYSSDGSTAYAAYRSITKTATSYTFSLTDTERNAMRNAIPNSKSMTVRFYLKTTISGTSYYSYISKTFSITNANPTISPTIKDTNATTLALTGSEDTIIKYFSDAAITIGAAAIKGATLSSQKASCGGKSITSSSGTLSAVESGTFTFNATDSRGNSSSLTVSKTFIDYVKLTANFKPTITIDGVISFTVSGNYFNGSFGAVSNTLSVSYRYKAEDGDFGDWVNLSPTISSKTYSSKVSFTIEDFDYRKSYTFQVKANDKLIILDTKDYIVNALPVFDWSKEDFNVNTEFDMNGITTLRRNEDLNSLIISSNGGDIYFRPVSSSDGNYQAHLYGDTGNFGVGGDIYVKGTKSLLGIYNAMTTAYTLTSTISAGANYSSASGNAVLVGNQLRVYFTATRSSATSTGNITDETVCSFSVDTGGKIAGTLWTVYGITTQSLSSYYVGNASASGNTLTFDIKLTACGISATTQAGYFSIPVRINPSAYV